LRYARAVMADILPFRKPDLRKKADGNTLCQRGFHKWVVVTEKKFDVKQGRLVTVLRCSRCGKQQTKLT
jgi:hypothetical protein